MRCDAIRQDWIRATEGPAGAIIGPGKKLYARIAKTRLESLANVDIYIQKI